MSSAFINCCLFSMSTKPLLQHVALPLSYHDLQFTVCDCSWSKSCCLTCIKCKLIQAIYRHETPPRCHRASPYGPLRTNVTSSITPEVHDISQGRQRRTEPRPQGICTQNFVQIGSAVPEICSWTDRQTYRNTLLPCRGGLVE